jgi:corrinoid protein of di/trimethylamine methyltransferase
MNLLKELENSVIEGNEGNAKQIAQDIVKKNLNIQEAIFSGLLSGMKKVGKLYENHEFFIPEIILSADALNAAFQIFTPHLKETKEKLKPTIVIGVVKGDIHEIGKNIVSTFLSISGYNVIDLGRNVHSNKFIETIEKTKAQVVCLSTLMSPTLDEMRLIVEKLEDKGIKDRVKVMIGGATTNSEFKEEIGADFYCKDAIEAVNTLNKHFSK